MTDISLQPEIYQPIVDENGNYVDHIPSIRYGLRCLCCSRKDHIYATYSAFSTHIKTKMHTKWLQHLNNNRTNYYVENQKIQELVRTQQCIITKLENTYIYILKVKRKIKLWHI